MFEEWIEQISVLKHGTPTLYVPHAILVLPCGCSRRAVAAPTRKGKRAEIEFVLERVGTNGLPKKWVHVQCRRTVYREVSMSAASEDQDAFWDAKIHGGYPWE